MPEQDKKERVLSGDTSITLSSDEYIARNLSQIRGEIYAVNNSDIEIDVYEPLQIEPESYSTNVEVGEPSVSTSSGRPRGADDSALALQILLYRIKKLKKPA